MKNRLALLLILIIAAFLRFYNLMFDSPYFFNPDERNMANAIVQLRMPVSLKEWPTCIWLEVSSIKYQVSEEDNKQPRPKDDRPMAENCNLHPHFFAYGQFPLYVSFLSDQVVKRISSHMPIQSAEYSAAIFWLRFWSALSSVGTVFVVYLMTKRLIIIHDESRITSPEFRKEHDDAPKFIRRTSYIAHVAAFLVACTPGLIQSAHFGTTESLLTFFLITSVYLSMTLVPPASSISTIIFLALICGFAFGTKLTGLFCLVAPALAAIFQLRCIMQAAHHRIRTSIRYIASWCIFLGCTIFISLIASPYNLIDMQGFKGAVFGYEKDVATGAYKAFYTRQFEGTIPILFQMKKIFPYTLGLPLFILGLSGFLYTVGSVIWQVFHTLWQAIHNRQREERSMQSMGNRYLFILLLSFLAYLIPNSILYTKWTRFMTPTLPFFSIFAALFCRHCMSIFKDTYWSVWGYRVIGFLVCSMALPGLAFFSVYLRDDVRVTATKWIHANIPDQAYILYDTGNGIDIPLDGPPNYTRISFDFYHMEETPELLPKLLDHLEHADYIFIPSRRIFANHLPRAKEFPTIASYYRHLFDGSLGFEEVAHFSSFPSLGPIQFPDEHAEETSTVFDHPVIRIYKKTRPLSEEEYAQLLD